VLETVSLDLFLGRQLGRFVRNFPALSSRLDIVAILDQFAQNFYQVHVAPCRQNACLYITSFLPRYRVVPLDRCRSWITTWNARTASKSRKTCVSCPWLSFPRYIAIVPLFYFAPLSSSSLTLLYDTRCVLCVCVVCVCVVCVCVVCVLCVVWLCVQNYPEYTARRVHTAQWVDGEKLSQSTADDVGALVNLGVITYLTQLLDTGFFHAGKPPFFLLSRPLLRALHTHLPPLSRPLSGPDPGPIQAFATGPTHIQELTPGPALPACSQTRIRATCSAPRTASW
jgi:hypothetical protein